MNDGDDDGDDVGEFVSSRPPPRRRVTFSPAMSSGLLLDAELQQQQQEEDNLEEDVLEEQQQRNQELQKRVALLRTEKRRQLLNKWRGQFDAETPLVFHLDESFAAETSSTMVASAMTWILELLNRYLFLPNDTFAEKVHKIMASNVFFFVTPLQLVLYTLWVARGCTQEEWPVFAFGVSCLALHLLVMISGQLFILLTKRVTPLASIPQPVLQNFVVLSVPLFISFYPTELHAATIGAASAIAITDGAGPAALVATQVIAGAGFWISRHNQFVFFDVLKNCFLHNNSSSWSASGSGSNISTESCMESLWSNATDGLDTPASVTSFSSRNSETLAERVLAFFAAVVFWTCTLLGTHVVIAVLSRTAREVRQNAEAAAQFVDRVYSLDFAAILDSSSFIMRRGGRSGEQQQQNVTFKTATIVAADLDNEPGQTSPLSPGRASSTNVGDATREEMRPSFVPDAHAVHVDDNLLSSLAACARRLQRYARFVPKNLIEAFHEEGDRVEESTLERKDVVVLALSISSFLRLVESAVRQVIKAPSKRTKKKKQGGTSFFFDAEEEIATAAAAAASFEHQAPLQMNDISPSAEATILDLVNEFHLTARTIVEQHGGFVVESEADSITAVFGAVQPSVYPGALACLAALHILSAADKEYSSRFDQLLEPTKPVHLKSFPSSLWHKHKHQNDVNSSPPLKFKVSIAIHRGGALVGNIGSSERHAYSAVGLCVDVAKGLCRLGSMRSHSIVLATREVLLLRQAAAGSPGAANSSSSGSSGSGGVAASVEASEMVRFAAREILTIKVPSLPRDELASSLSSSFDWSEKAPAVTKLYTVLHLVGICELILGAVTGEEIFFTNAQQKGSTADMKNRRDGGELRRSESNRSSSASSSDGSASDSETADGNGSRFKHLAEWKLKNNVSFPFSDSENGESGDSTSTSTFVGSSGGNIGGGGNSGGTVDRTENVQHLSPRVNDDGDLVDLPSGDALLQPPNSASFFSSPKNVLLRTLDRLQRRIVQRDTERLAVSLRALDDGMWIDRRGAQLLEVHTIMIRYHNNGLFGEAARYAEQVVGSLRGEVLSGVAEPGRSQLFGQGVHTYTLRTLGARCRAMGRNLVRKRHKWDAAVLLERDDNE